MGTDGGTDTTIERQLHLEPGTRHDGHLHPAPGAGLDVAGLDAELGRVVAGLRAGDLAFVVTAAVRLGPALAVCLDAVGLPASDDLVTDVAFALSDLAAGPATATWSTGELLAAAVAGVAGARGAPGSR